MLPLGSRVNATRVTQKNLHRLFGNLGAGEREFTQVLGGIRCGKYIFTLVSLFDILWELVWDRAVPTN